MPIMNILKVDSFEGWAKAIDTRAVLLKMRNADGLEFALEVPYSMLMEFIVEMVRATAAIPGQKKMAFEETPGMGVSRIDFGKVEGDLPYALRVHPVLGGSLTFLMDETMPEGLVGNIKKVVGL